MGAEHHVAIRRAIPNHLCKKRDTVCRIIIIECGRIEKVNIPGRKRDTAGKSGNQEHQW